MCRSKYMYLNNYFNFHICLPVLLPPSECVQKLTTIPAGVPQNFTDKSCLVCFEGKDYLFGSPRPLLYPLDTLGQPKGVNLKVANCESCYALVTDKIPLMGGFT